MGGNRLGVFALERIQRVRCPVHCVGEDTRIFDCQMDAGSGGWINAEAWVLL